MSGSASRAGRIAVDQLPRQLALEHDDRQRVTEHILEVTGDPLAFSELREPFHFGLRQAQLGVCHNVSRRLNVDGSDHGEMTVIMMVYHPGMPNRKDVDALTTS